MIRDPFVYDAPAHNLRERFFWQERQKKLFLQRGEQEIHYDAVFRFGVCVAVV